MDDEQNGAASYHLNMKRKDVVAAVETVRQSKIRSIVDFFGKGLWKGDLSEMREDSPRHTVQHKRVQSKKVSEAKRRGTDE